MSNQNISTIYLGTDHAGFELKEFVKSFLEEENYNIVDKGAFWYDSEDDYPDFIFPAAEEVSADKSSRGIIFGGSGQGEAMAANRVTGVRAVGFYGIHDNIVKLSREHNNSNILSIGARFVDEEEVKKLLHLWLDTEFDGGRHERRIKKLDNFR